MEREKFYEESAISTRSEKEKKLYTVFKVAAIVFFVFFGIQFFMSFPYIGNVVANENVTTSGKALFIVMWVGLTLTWLLIGFLLFKLKNRFNVSYDYTFVEDEIRFTKVFNGKRRKFITTVTMDQILKIGYCDKPSFEAALRGNKGKKPKILTPNKEPDEEKMFIYLIVNTSLERRIYVLECRKLLLEYLVFAAGRTKLERE